MSNSIRASLKRLQGLRHRHRLASIDELLVIGKRSAAGLSDEPIDHAEFLYDEHGLPK